MSGISTVLQATFGVRYAIVIDAANKKSFVLLLSPRENRPTSDPTATTDHRAPNIGRIVSLRRLLTSNARPPSRRLTERSSW